MRGSREADIPLEAMTSTRTLYVSLALLLVFVTAAPASAQIFSCRDGAGNLILSDQRSRCGASQTYAVGGAVGVRTTRQAAPGVESAYDELISTHARSAGVDANLVRAVVQVESGFNPRALSPKGARGLMQLMPGTAAEYGVRNAYNPSENIRGGVAYLRSLLERYNWDESLALAAYNAGPTAVQRYGNSVPPYRETKNYVSKVRGISGPTIAARGKLFYKTIEIVNGQPVPKYSNTRPSGGVFEVVSF
jgi:soluble lytic murein transglycosylase-like protein